MIKALKVALILLVSILTACNSTAQIIKDPTKWTLEAKKISDNKYQLIVHVTLQNHWHIWSFKPGGDGLQVIPEITFAKNPDVTFEGTVVEKGKLLSETIDGIDGEVHYFRDKVDYIQSAIINKNTKITCSYFYQVCDTVTCLAPKKGKPLSVEIKDAGGAINNTATPADTLKTAGITPDTTKTTGDTSKKVAAAAPPKNNQGSPEGKNGLEDKSLLALFLISLGSGLAAVFTPCIFSMIPITVSFFTKRSKTKQEGIRNAIYYSLSIIAIFTLLGVVISTIFGPARLNELSTHWIANMIFFIMIVIFALSFLGAFEITLPSSWTNVTDSKAGTGSIVGIFFMALTLSIVSFSCTGPIVGPLLVLASKGGIAGPTVGMLGFSLGLSLPFALFAIFPGWLNKMAASGGWLNQVKVVLGFIELMLALKFLSNADLQKGWRLLDREIFIAIWIVLSILTGFYLLGKLKLSHDDAPAQNIYGQEYVNTFKLFLSILFFTFAVYLLPGMWGAPLNGVSAFIPPMGTFDEFGGGVAVASQPSGINESKPIKYVAQMEKFEPPVVKRLGLQTYYDYDEAVAASKRLKRPLMLDFTGIGCVNCRKMEAQVWAKPEVAKRLKEDFVVVSLYCDAYQVEIAKEEQFFSKELDKQVTSLADKCTHIQVSKFGSNTQPFYFYVDENGNKLIDIGYAYDPDVDKFVKHLDAVKENYKKSHP